MVNKTIGILAHVDAGKTTLAEQILYYTNSIRNRGRVDHKNSFLDNHNIEKERGITIFAEQGVFSYNDSTYYLIDTPGHMDFSMEMERSIQILDYAILIISCVEGVQSHTETVWRLLRKYNVPTFIFINKIDRIGANVDKIIDEIKIKLDENVINFTENYEKDKLSDKLIEFLAERNEVLLEKYLNGEYDSCLWEISMKDMINNKFIFPCFVGSALQDMGIGDFVDKLDKLTVTNYNSNKDFSGRIYKIRHDNQGEKIAYIKLLEGSLKVKDEIAYIIGEQRLIEKINQIRLYNGDKFKTVDKVSAGEVFAVTGLSNVVVGQGIGSFNEESGYETVSTLKSKVIFSDKINPKAVLKVFRILEAEDNSLNVTWDEELQEIHINIMGPIQLEVLKEISKERFNIDIEFGPCEILYKETITTESIGYGHFEPLKHYAEVHLELKPGKRGSGITFNSKCHVDDLSVGYQNLVRTHIFERQHRGILTGTSITDIEISLLTGRSHNKHTSGGDFREATFRALRQGLEKAKNIVLEPYYCFKIDVDIDYMGRVLSDIQKLNGIFNPPENCNNKVIITGRAPVATFMNYSVELLAVTKGKGIINLIFDGYDYCHNEEEVINKIGYDKNADIKYTSSSIFCSKGQGYVVDGCECEKYMHCL